MPKVFKVTPARRARWQASVAALEASARYPLGSDFFRLDHGKDYFAFFNRLGDLHYYAVAHEGEAVAVGAGILRKIPFRSGAAVLKTWYLCDLKVHPRFRGTRLPLQMLTRAFPLNYLRCPRGYAISMNPAQGANRVVRLLSRFRWARTSYAGDLLIYSMDEKGMIRLQPLIERHRGPVSYLSLEGIKDLTLESTGQRLPLLHLQHGVLGQPGLPSPRPGHTHMFCVPERDPLARELEAEGVRSSATASIIHHRMEAADWNFILTSDI